MSQNENNEKTFSVIDYSSFFAVRHNPSGEEYPMGDGVDTLWENVDGEFCPACPGSDGFIELWEDSLNYDESSTMEAYFPQYLED